jgi:large subunit ribosomal protein L24
MKIQKGDKVKVTTGKNKGIVGAVLSVNTKKNLVVVEGVNVRKRAVKKTETNNENYIYLQHGINASNVRLVDDNGAFTKVRSAKPAVEAVVKKAAAPKKAKTTSDVAKTVKSEKKSTKAK